MKPDSIEHPGSTRSKRFQEMTAELIRLIEKHKAWNMPEVKGLLRKLGISKRTPSKED